MRHDNSIRIIAARAKNPLFKTASNILPLERWDQIVDLLMPDIQPDQHMFPQPHPQSLRSSTPFRLEYKKDLSALALTCEELNLLVLRKVFRAPFLKNQDAAKKFMHAMHRGDQRQLRYGLDTSVHWIRALHIGAQIFCTDRYDVPEPYPINTQVLLSLADQVQYLSLTHAHRQSDFCDGEVDQLRFIEFLSPATRCRPRGLRLSLQGEVKELDLQGGTSYAPLSELTHLELEGLLPSPELIGFLAGRPAKPNGGWRKNKLLMDAISAGQSPHLKLECLRFSRLPREALHHFDALVAYMMAEEEYKSLSWDQRRNHPMPEAPDMSEECWNLQLGLYELASNSDCFPNLRLIIIDVGQTRFHLNEELLELLVYDGFLRRASKHFPPVKSSSEWRYTSSQVSSLFNTISSSRDSEAAEAIMTELLFDEPDNRFINFKRNADEHWTLTQAGKQAFINLWKRSRGDQSSEGVPCVPTDIRVTSGRYHRDSEETPEKSSYCQAAMHSAVGRNVARDPADQVSSTDVSLRDWGIWADPDVFSLIEERPWLPYVQLNEFGSCWWTGELPRDSNPNSYPSGEDGQVRRVQNLPVVILDRAALSDEQKEEVRELMARRPWEDTQEPSKLRRKEDPSMFRASETI